MDYELSIVNCQLAMLADYYSQVGLFVFSENYKTEYFFMDEVF